MNVLNITIKYSYYRDRDQFKAVGELWDLVKRPQFKNDRMIELKKNPSPIPPNKNVSPVQFNLEIKNNDKCPVEDNIVRSTMRFLELIERGNEIDFQTVYGNDPQLVKKISRLVKYNHPRLVGGKITAEINKVDSGWELRDIRILAQYPSINKQSSENIVLDFSESGQLADVTFSILRHIYNQVVDIGKAQNDWARQQTILKFLERYRTAMLTRDMQTIEAVYADSAIIIIGKKIMLTKMPDSINYQQIDDGQPTYEYLTLTKNQYLKRQREVFKAQEAIFINFASLKTTKKANVDGIYGISLRQDYSSTTYSDEGYLFLLIDFSDEYPLIYVRAWQPQEWDDRKMIKAANFKLWGSSKN